MPKMLLCPVDLRDALVEYLLQRPCREVMDGVLMLKALQPAPEIEVLSVEKADAPPQILEQ